MSNLLDLSAAHVTETGLDLPPGLDYARVERLVVQLAKAERAVQFWIGDALLYMEREFGDKYTEIEAALANAGIPRSRETLRAYAWTARRICERSSKVTARDRRKRQRFGWLSVCLVGLFSAVVVERSP